MSDAAARPDVQENASHDVTEPVAFEYAEAAELFTHAAMIAPRRPPEASAANTAGAPMQARRSRGIAYRRFSTSAEAIRFAIEVLPSAHLLATVLVVNGDRYDGNAIKALYVSSDFPLIRAQMPTKRVARSSCE